MLIPRAEELSPRTIYLALKNTAANVESTLEKSGSGIRPLRRRPLFPINGRTLRGKEKSTKLSREETELLIGERKIIRIQR